MIRRLFATQALAARLVTGVSAVPASPGMIRRLFATQALAARLVTGVSAVPASPGMIRRLFATQALAARLVTGVSAVPASPGMIRRGIATLAMAAGLVGLTAPPASAAPLTGKVVMKTAGAPLPPGLQVTVVEISPAGDMASPQHVPVAPDGSYGFEGDPAREHLIGTIYKDITYSFVAPPGSQPAQDLNVYETTGDVAVVRVVSDTLTAIPNTDEDQAEVLEVLQVLRFRNSSDRSYTGDGEGNGVLKLPVAESAFDLASAEDGNPSGIATTPRGLASTVALPPGETSIPYLYKVRVPRSGWQLRREVYYPTATADLLVGQGLKLSAAPGFQFQETKSLGGKSYRRYRGSDLRPGRVLAADVGFGNATSGDSGVWYGAGAILAVVAAAGIGGAMAVRRRRSLRPAGGPASSRDELIDQVAKLDESFEDGGLDRAEYEARRSRLIARLKAASP